LYFGSTKGMVAFQPGEIHQYKMAPPLYFMGLIAGGAELITGNKNNIVLPYNHSTFSISFAALSYAASGSIRYSYKMQGINDGWTLLEKNQPVSFTDLTPGEYVFSVKAALPGRWESQEKQMSIKITPPFWASKWAYTFYVFVLMLFILGYINYAKNREKLRYEIKRTEQLQEFNNEMLMKNNELQQTYRSLEQSHRENDRMIKVIAHDLRSPMGAIVGFTEWMIGSKDKRPQEILPLLNKTATDALTLVDELLHLNFSHSSTPKDRLDLKALIQHCVDMMQPAAEKKKQFLWYEPAEAYVAADQEKLWRVFSNLLNNAIKFSPPSKNIYVKMRLEGDQVITFVQDEGIGIPDFLKDKIFNAVPEIKRKGTEGEPSFGLGLHITHQIIELHEGRIWVDSQQGKGTTFYVSLPVLPGKSLD
jgi:signal transduction histidine kinase